MFFLCRNVCPSCPVSLQYHSGGLSLTWSYQDLQNSFWSYFYRLFQQQEQGSIFSDILSNVTAIDDLLEILNPNSLILVTLYETSQFNFFI